MAITVKTIGEQSLSANPGDIIKLIRDVFQDLEDQLNQRAQIYVSTDGRVPAGLNRNDILLISYRGNITLGIKNRNGMDTLTAAMLGGLTANSTSFKGVLRKAANPVVADFPNPNDWGFFFKTNTTTAFYLCFNLDGTLMKVALT